MHVDLLRIGELAARAGVSTRTVDFYTSLGLLRPAGRTAGNFRLYDPTTVDWIATIRRLEANGVSLEEIAALTRGSTDLASVLGRLEQDLQDLQVAAQAAAGPVQSLLAALAVRAHTLLSTALEIASSLPPG